MSEKQKQIELMSHALGGHKYYQQKGFYRNYFAAEENSDDKKSWDKLVESGDACIGRKSSINDKLIPYHVTDQGQDKVKIWLREQKEKEPKLTRSQKRYRAYLSLDFLTESYGEWLKNPQWDDFRREKEIT